jgi:hypothetical protein
MFRSPTNLEIADRIFPREAFRFKSRKTPPADIATLMAQLRRDVGTTSGQDHLQVIPSLYPLLFDDLAAP